MASSDIHKTSITTPFGAFEYKRMPYGLKNAAQSFQRVMDEVCRGLRFTFVYVDDILVASTNREQHKTHLRQLFEQTPICRTHHQPCEVPVREDQHWFPRTPHHQRTVSPPSLTKSERWPNSRNRSRYDNCRNFSAWLISSTDSYLVLHPSWHPYMKWWLIIVSWKDHYYPGHSSPRMFSWKRGRSWRD